MSRASGTDRASRSSFGTTSVSPRAYRSHRLIKAGTLAFGAAEAVVDVDAIRRNAERVKRLALGSEVLLASRASGVSNQCFIHPRSVLRSVALINRRASESRPASETGSSGAIGGSDERHPHEVRRREIQLISTPLRRRLSRPLRPVGAVRDEAPASDHSREPEVDAPLPQPAS